MSKAYAELKRSYKNKEFNKRKENSHEELFITPLSKNGLDSKANKKMYVSENKSELLLWIIIEKLFQYLNLKLTIEKYVS